MLEVKGYPGEVVQYIGDVPPGLNRKCPSLYEASWRADARMSISMRLSCKVSRNVCFAMFLHTGGKMDMKLV